MGKNGAEIKVPLFSCCKEGRLIGRQGEARYRTSEDNKRQCLMWNLLWVGLTITVQWICPCNVHDFYFSLSMKHFHIWVHGLPLFGHRFCRGYMTIDLTNLLIHAKDDKLQTTAIYVCGKCYEWQVVAYLCFW